MSYQKKQNQQTEDRGEEIDRKKRLCRDEREAAHKVGKQLCRYCDFTGMVTAIDDETGNSYIFRCKACLAGDKMNLSYFPFWEAGIYPRFKVQFHWTEKYEL